MSNGFRFVQLDVVAFANLAQLYYLSEEVNHPLRDAMNQTHSNLVGLVSRVKERAFPDWDTLCSTLELNTHLPKPAKEVLDTKEGCDPAEKKPLPDEPEKEKVSGSVHGFLKLSYLFNKIYR